MDLPLLDSDSNPGPESVKPLPTEIYDDPWPGIDLDLSLLIEDDPGETRKLLENAREIEKWLERNARIRKIRPWE